MLLDKDKIRHLKSLAHQRKPVVLIGQKGLTENVLNEVKLALDHHELIKIKVNVGDRDDRNDIIDSLTADTGATCIQRIGNIAVLFLRNEKKPVIVFAG
ncbi:ribosome assembly RNA-binding protein YhbY [Granulosicoccaceae sp. 1_MG-2023]|nr:ribosome assembly RNA-binding protein YhbY [Granulosicoccaceae sp. 1_MG-2023]